MIGAAAPRESEDMGVVGHERRLQRWLRLLITVRRFPVGGNARGVDLPDLDPEIAALGAQTLW